MKARQIVIGVLAVLAVVVMTLSIGCVKNHRPFPVINESFPIPSGTVVGKIEGNFFDVVLVNEYDYFPKTVDVSIGDSGYYLFLTKTSIKGEQWQSSWLVGSPMFVRGDATAKYPIVDSNLGFTSFLVPDSTDPKYDKIKSEPLMLPISVIWLNKDKGYTFEVPVKILLYWRVPRQ
jgi:hypothetical protein